MMADLMGEIPALDIVNLKYAACLRQVMNCVWGGGGRSFFNLQAPASSIQLNGVIYTSLQSPNHHGLRQLGSAPVRCSARRCISKVARGSRTHTRRVASRLEV